MNEITMNRLVLIGNGFDLAHGLKTSYKDFITDYLRNALKKFIEEEKYEDDLLSLSIHADLRSRPKVDISDFDAIEEFILQPNLQSRRENNTNIIIQSQLLRLLLKNLNEFKWVGIENKYYEALNALKNDLTAVKKLNDDFEYLREKLEKYLQKVDVTNQDSFSTLLLNRFTENIKKDEIVSMKLEENIKPENIYFLNFNYTSTIFKYTNYRNSYNNIQWNFIHGVLGNSNNPIIFGFGDEFDKNFQEFEELKNDELFRHIKSFKYSKTSNYHNLIRFIESENFQVYIVGHSCGVSDRTMLREIFEHDNCKSIKIFYHERADGSNDFLEKTYNISRHFTDNGVMRKKLVPFENSLPMPQPKR